MAANVMDAHLRVAEKYLCFDVVCVSTVFWACIIEGVAHLFLGIGYDESTEVMDLGARR